MRKMFIMELATILVGGCLLSGCGTSATGNIEEVDIEDKLHQAIEVVAEIESYETEYDEDVMERTAKNQNVVDADLNMDVMVENSNVTIETLNDVERQFDPVVIAAEEKWMDVLEMTSELKANIAEINAKAAEKASVKLTDINLEEGTVSYSITSPDIVAYLSDNMSEKDSMNTICKNVIDSLEDKEFPYTEQMITLPLEVNGTDLKVNLESEEVMGAITGGFYNILTHIQ